MKLSLSYEDSIGPRCDNVIACPFIASTSAASVVDFRPVVPVTTPPALFFEIFESGGQAKLGEILIVSRWTRALTDRIPLRKIFTDRPSP